MSWPWFIAGVVAVLLVIALLAYIWLVRLIRWGSGL